MHTKFNSPAFYRRRVEGGTTAPESRDLGGTKSTPSLKRSFDCVPEKGLSYRLSRKWKCTLRIAGMFIDNPPCCQMDEDLRRLGRFALNGTKPACVEVGKRQCNALDDRYGLLPRFFVPFPDMAFAAFFGTDLLAGTLAKCSFTLAAI